MFQKIQTLRPIRIAIKSNNRHQEERVLSPEMRKAMRDGIQRKLCPRKQYDKPLLKLDKENKTEISKIKNKISNYKQMISEIESQKTQLDKLGEIKIFNYKIEMILYKIFKFQTQIRNIKIQQYKKQLSTQNLNKSV